MTARGHARAAPAPTLAVALSAVVLGAAILSSCSANGQSSPAASSVPVPKLGYFPVATGSAAVHAPVVATPGHPGIVVMGDTVNAELSGSVDVSVTARGPDFRLPQTIPTVVRGVITVTIISVRGVYSVRRSDFHAVDEERHRIALTTHGLNNAPSSNLVPAGSRLTFRLTGNFRAGNASLVWTPGGVAMAVWEFTAEYD